MADLCKPPMPIAENEDEVVHYEIEGRQETVWEPYKEEQVDHAAGQQVDYQSGAQEYYRQYSSLEQQQAGIGGVKTTTTTGQQGTTYYHPTEASGGAQEGVQSSSPQQQQYHPGMTSYGETAKPYEGLTTSESGSGRKISYVSSHRQKSHSPQSIASPTYFHVSGGQQEQHAIPSKNVIEQQQVDHAAISPSLNISNMSPELKNYYLNSISPLPDTVPHITTISPTVTVVSYAPQKSPTHTIHQVHGANISDYKKTKDILIEPSIENQELTLQNNPLLISEDLKAAVACGRVYGPEKAAYVPGEVVKHAGMTTVYDAFAVPTFETELEVFAMPTPALAASTKEMATLMEETAVPTTVAGTGILKKVAQARRRMYCC